MGNESMMERENLVGRLAVAGVRSLAPRLRHGLIFGTASFCLPAQKLLNRLSGGQHTVQFRFKRGTLSGGTFECLSTEKYYYMREDFEIEIQDVLRAHIRPGVVVYDVGANIGMLSLLIAGMGARVYSFEPSPKNYRRLVVNLGLNPSLSIHAQNAGASDSERTGHLTDNGSMSEVSDHGLQIRLIRLDDFTYRDGNAEPTFLKIDVEGHAAKVLAGMPRLLAKRPTLIIEIHNDEEAMLLPRLDHEYVVRLLEARRYPYRILATPRGCPTP